MKTLGFAILAFILFAQCTKEKRFENGIQGNWNIDKFSYYNDYSTSCGGPGETFVYDKENTGSLKLTDKKYPTKVAYSTTDQQYYGYWTDESGIESEFAYEYLKKLDGTYTLTFFRGGPTNIGIEILTKNYWRFSTNTYFGGCEYDLYKYELRK